MRQESKGRRVWRCAVLVFFIYSPGMSEKIERSSRRDGEGEGEMPPLTATVALI